MMAAKQDEIPPPLIDTNEAQCADGMTQERHSPRSGAAAAISKVLEDDNLLIEILLCLGFPTTLARAALVCKRWYHHASDRGFLKKFRKRHPPRLLGFYIDEQVMFSPELEPPPYFVPMPSQPLELAAVVRRVTGYSFGNLSIRYCRNGHIFTRSYQGRKFQHGLHRPLCPEEGMHIVLPELTSKKPFDKLVGTILSREDTCGDLSYMYFLAEWTNKQTNLRVYVLQDGAWCPIATHQIATPPILHSLCAATAALFGNKIYIANSLSSNILVFDFTASTLSRIPLPPEVKYDHSTSTLSQADNASGIYLTHVHGKDLQLHIWLHKGDNWLLVHTICLHEMCANLGLLDHTIEDEDTNEDTDIPCVCHVGDNAEFVFLQMCGCTLYLDVTRKTMQKVHEMAEKNQSFDVYPFMMTWPPIFPTLKDDSARNAM